jgi:hypothetical protein
VILFLLVHDEVNIQRWYVIYFSGVVCRAAGGGSPAKERTCRYFLSISGEVFAPCGNCQIAHFSKLFDGLRRVAPGRGSLPLDDVCLSLLNMLYLQTLPFLQSGNREEVSDVDYLLNLLVAVIANVGGSLISKWLDNHHKKGK